MKNIGIRIFRIKPYNLNGTWCFDDVDRGLYQEPFVKGVPEILNKMTWKFPNASKGFLLFFSSKAFPRWTHSFVWQREEDGGNWYFSNEYKIEGWLCPALFKYFDVPPQYIYARLKE